MEYYAALLFALASSGVGAFHLALIFGVPWGEFTLGGRWPGSLPKMVRIIPILSVLLLGFFCAVILARAGIARSIPLEHSGVLAWLVVGSCAIASIANCFTPSRRERRVWLPVVGGMFALSFCVAMAS